MPFARQIAIFSLVMLQPLVAVSANLSESGPAAVGYRKVTIARPDQTTFPARVYYPALTAGTDVPVDATDGPHPLVVFGHGFQTPVAFYQSTLEHLATWRFVVCAPESGMELFPSHEAFATDFRLAADWFEVEVSKPGSFWFGKVDPSRFGLCGHSMGAGCSVLAAADEGPRLKVLVPLAVAETRPSAATAAALVNAPQIFIVGSEDQIVPLATNSQPIIDAALTPKSLFNLQGGFHCGYLDRSIPLVCDNGSLLRNQQLALVRQILTQSFLLYLCGDDTVWSTAWGPQALKLPKTVTTLWPGLSWSPDIVSITGAAGAVVTAELTLTNTGPHPTGVELFVEGNSWPVETEIAPGVAELAAGESQTVKVAVKIPADPRALLDQGTLSARSSADGHTRGYCQLRLRRTQR